MEATMRKTTVVSMMPVQTRFYLLVTRVNSTNVLDEGLRIGGIGRRMNSKVNQSNKVYIESKLGGELGLLSIWPSPSSPVPYIYAARSQGT
jgi:hypothetical protein